MRPHARCSDRVSLPFLQSRAPSPIRYVVPTWKARWCFLNGSGGKPFLEIRVRSQNAAKDVALTCHNVSRPLNRYLMISSILTRDEDGLLLTTSYSANGTAKSLIAPVQTLRQNRQTCRSQSPVLRCNATFDGNSIII